MTDEASATGSDSPIPQAEASWALNHLAWPEAARALARNPRLLVPVGALAQHGPHLPLGTNTFITEAVARDVSRANRVLLAPTFHYGVTGRGRRDFPGSAGIERKTLHRAMNELLAEWEDHGVREFIILTAHRHVFHLDALLMAMTSSANTVVVNLLAIPTDDLLDSSPEWEHGGELETSVLLYLAPHLVRTDQIVDAPPDPDSKGRYARGWDATPPSGGRGAAGFPSRASPKKGRQVYLRYIESVTEILTGSSQGSTGIHRNGLTNPLSQG